jgi:hypothetical protein
MGLAGSAWLGRLGWVGWAGSAWLFGLLWVVGFVWGGGAGLAPPPVNLSAAFGPPAGFESGWCLWLGVCGWCLWLVLVVGRWWWVLWRIAMKLTTRIPTTVLPTTSVLPMVGMGDRNGFVAAGRVAAEMAKSVGLVPGSGAVCTPGWARSVLAIVDARRREPVRDPVCGNSAVWIDEKDDAGVEAALDAMSRRPVTFVGNELDNFEVENREVGGGG